MFSTVEITTLDAAYQKYAPCFPNKAAKVKTALFHYLLPYKGFGFNFQVLPGEQLHNEKLELAWKLASQIKLEDLSVIAKVLTWQEEVFNSINASRSVRRPNKHYLKHFLEWCKNEGLTTTNQPNDWAVPQSLPGVSKAYHRRGGREKQLILNRRPLLEYSADLELLSDSMKKQIEEFTSFWTCQHYEGVRPIPQLVDLSTHESRLDHLSYIIGWFALDKLDYHQRMWESSHTRKEKDPDFHSEWLLIEPEPPMWLKEMSCQYPPRSLNSIKLSELVPVIEIRPDKLSLEFSPSIPQNNTSNSLLQAIQNELQAQNATLSFDTIIQLGQALNQNQTFVEEVSKLNLITAKTIAQEKANADIQKACEQIRSLVKNFLRWLEYQHNPTNSENGYRISPNYRAGFCVALMNLAKYFYREMTNPRMKDDYQDIEIIMEIRNLKKEELSINFKPNHINPIKRNPTWQELGKLLKDLLVACAPRRQIIGSPDYQNMGPLRKQSAVATDLQKYLIMMFFRLISPDRQHIIRNLKLHNTLKLCWINWDNRTYEEAPWDAAIKRYKAHYNTKTKLYYLDKNDVKDEKGNAVCKPQGKAFSWVVFLDATQTKIDQENAYRVPKIYNPELEAWLHGREDYSETWFNWPKVKGAHSNKFSKKQYYWCGYINIENDEKLGFREIFKPTHDFVFTQQNGKVYSRSNMCRLYDAILWRFLGIRSNPHAVRSAAIGYFKTKGMTDAENESLAKLKSHSSKMQDSPTYNKLLALEKTAKASEMIVNDFLEEYNLDPTEFGLVGRE